MEPLRPRVPEPETVRPPATPPAEWRWPAIHPEGIRFGGLFGLGAVLAFALGWTLLAWPLVAATAFTFLFFRDPVRVSPVGDDILVAPADGLVSQIKEVPIPPQLAGEGGLTGARAVRVSIFLSVFDVHINRTPTAGRVARLTYVPGKFLNANLDKASEDNERQYLLIETADGTRVGVVQIAGLIARRILTFVSEGETLLSGERFGLIRFGSRTDLYVPEGYVLQIGKGQRAIGGETVIARRGVPPVETGPRQ
ncbi:MAG: phosphatidylserine decarboxylase [Thermaurantiacus sp.]